MWEVLVLEGKKGGGENQVMERVPSARGHHLDHMRHGGQMAVGERDHPWWGEWTPLGTREEA